MQGVRRNGVSRMSLKQDISGIEAIADWLGGTGLTVSPVLAEFRADRCTKGNDGKPCPNNMAPGWWNTAKEVVADWIRKQLEVKNNMRIATSQDDDLHMCKSCGCCIKLKVWTPLEHIRAHTPTDQINKYPNYCWIRKELETVR